MLRGRRSKKGWLLRSQGKETIQEAKDYRPSSAYRKVKENQNNRISLDLTIRRWLAPHQAGEVEKARG